MVDPPTPRLLITIVVVIVAASIEKSLALTAGTVLDLAITGNHDATAAACRHCCHSSRKLKVKRNEDFEGMDSSLQKRRRKFLKDNLSLGLLAFFPATKANAFMENSQTVFEVGKDLSLDEAKERFRAGQESLDYLLDHYDEITSIDKGGDKGGGGGGDNIRRYLGTVGTTSGLYGISRVLKTILMLQDNLDNVVQYTEAMETINRALMDADGYSYMAMFTKAPPDKYFENAKVEIQKARAAMQEIARMLDIR